MGRHSWHKYEVLGQPPPPLIHPHKHQQKHRSGYEVWGKCVFVSVHRDSQYEHKHNDKSNKDKDMIHYY